MDIHEEGPEIQLKDFQETEGVFDYKDIVPGILTPPGEGKKFGELEQFAVLVIRANEWLASNPGYRVKSCESLRVDLNYLLGNSDSDSPVYKEYGGIHNCYVGCLRLWYTVTASTRPQEIGYVTIAPECTNAGSFCSEPQFESFADIFNRLNELLERDSLPGRILNVETRNMKLRSSPPNVRPEDTLWYEQWPSFYYMIRVFYECGTPTSERLGYVDFVPDVMKPGSTCRQAEFEPMNALVTKANAWISSHPESSVISVQSVKYKMSSKRSGKDKLDTMHSIYYGGSNQLYIRILRVIYISTADSGHSSFSPLTMLSYKTFVPLQTGDQNYEDTEATGRRVAAWLTATGAKCIGTETVDYQLHHRSSKWHTLDPESTSFMYLGATKGTKYWMRAVRVYLDGIYEEPPADLLPPEPEIQASAQNKCCALM